MSVVIFEANTYTVKDDETVLDTLLANGHDIPNGCRAGVCQACLLVAEEGTIPPAAQIGLSDAQKQLNCFLACQCLPRETITVKTSDTALTVDAKVAGITKLNRNVYRLLVEAELDYFAGQYVTLTTPTGVARSYSIASVAGESQIEFHIKSIEGGQFGRWLASARLGETLKIQGPMGKCIYSANADQPMLLAAMGTGLAPIYGILKTSLAAGHSGAIELFASAKNAESIYLKDELTALASQHSNLRVVFAAQEGEADKVELCDIYARIKADVADLKGYKVYLCGGDSFVRKVRKQAFLGGAGMGDIHTDVFLPFGGI